MADHHSSPSWSDLARGLPQPPYCELVGDVGWVGTQARLSALAEEAGSSVPASDQVGGSRGVTMFHWRGQAYPVQAERVRTSLAAAAEVSAWPQLVHPTWKLRLPVHRAHEHAGARLRPWQVVSVLQCLVVLWYRLASPEGAQQRGFGGRAASGVVLCT